MKNMNPARSGAELESGHHKFSGNGAALKTSLVFAATIITCTILLNQQFTNPIQFFHNFSYTNIFSSPDPPREINPERYENRELGEMLSKASMKNRTVIITTLNAAWTEPNFIFDLFLESFRIGNGTAELVKHVVVGAFDQTAYKRCLAEGLHCYALTTEGVDFSGEAFFMSEDYLKMTWRKVEFQRTVLELGYDFIFTDADVMWLRNPFDGFYPDGDFQIACDYYTKGRWPNTGFIYAKSSNRTIHFYKVWYTGKDYFPGNHDQDVFNIIKTKPFIPRIGLEVRFLDTALFGGFCEHSKVLDRVIMMHANCCAGLGNKTHDMKIVIDDWKRYISISAHQRNSTIRSWTMTVQRICTWKEITKLV